MEIPTLLSLAVLLGMALLPSLLLAFLIPYKFVAFADEDNALAAAMEKDNAAGVSGPGYAAVARLKELNEAYEGKLITREEFDAKRKEILKGL